jgi:threonyl-tRNA synthetase
MIHCAIMGSIERFSAVLIEHLGGNFPLWLSPTQVAIIPVADVHNEYAIQVSEALKSIGIRVSINTENDSMGKKIREAKKDRLPYFIVIGDKEVSEKTVTLEKRDGTSKSVSLNEVGNHLLAEIESKTL